MMNEFHEKYGTGHGSAIATTNQILRAGYYWPTLFKDVHHHVRTCHTCQTAATRERYVALPLQSVIEVRPFAQWGIDFIGPINPLSSSTHYLLRDTSTFSLLLIISQDGLKLLLVGNVHLRW